MDEGLAFDLCNGSVRRLPRLSMDNASLILQTLDGHLHRPARLIVYGSSISFRSIGLRRAGCGCSARLRGDDPQDLADIAFLIRHDRVTPDQIESALADAVIPDLTELRDAFERAKPLVRDLAGAALYLPEKSGSGEGLDSLRGGY
jgi:hypothetical protein